VDSITIRSGVGAADWPAAGAKTATGWWPDAAAAAGVAGVAGVPCPTGSGAVKDSAVLRTDAAYPLSGTATAAYTEWMVSCADGTGAVPRLWLIGKGDKIVAVSAMSVDPRYDADVLRIVASMGPAAG
jgi:hypothetical protein